jgi:hypothetical protein
MSKLFNTEDGEQFHGVLDDLAKARKGTPQYEEWLRKYREKKGANNKEVADTAAETKRLLALSPEERSEAWKKSKFKDGKHISAKEEKRRASIESRAQDLNEIEKMQAKADAEKDGGFKVDGVSVSDSQKRAAIRTTSVSAAHTKLRSYSNNPDKFLSNLMAYKKYSSVGPYLGKETAISLSTSMYHSNADFKEKLDKIMTIK